MDAEAKGLLQRLVTLTEENNTILKKLHRAQVWNTIFFAIRVIVFIAVSFGLYFYVNTYFDRIRNIYNQTGGGQMMEEIKRYGELFNDFLQKTDTQASPQTTK